MKLRLQPGEALLRLEAQLFSRESRVVDYSISYFVPATSAFTLCGGRVGVTVKDR